MSPPGETSVPVVPLAAVPYAEPPPLPQPEPPRGSAGYAPITPWPPLAGLGVTILIMLIVVLVLGAGAGAVALSHPGAFAREASGVKLHFEEPVVAYSFAAVMLVSQLLGVVLTFWFAGLRGGRPVDVLALQRPVSGFAGGRPETGYVAYFWAIPAFVVFGFLVGGLVTWVSPQSSQADTEIMLQLTRSPGWWLIFLAAVVLAPLQEELLFRGFLFSALAKSPLRLIGTALVTSAGWAIIHGYSPQGNATIFALGLALSFILWRTGSTRVTMLCHGSYNALAFLAAMFAPTGGGG